MMKTLQAALALVLLVALGAPLGAKGATDPDPAFGQWLVENGRAIIEIAPCGNQACGRIVWLEEPLDATGRLKTDRNNPDPLLQSRPLCGMELIGGFKRDGFGKWQDGWIYNARDGERYDATLKIASDGSLEVRGYVGLTLFGSSQQWTRVPNARGGCPN